MHCENVEYNIRWDRIAVVSLDRQSRLPDLLYSFALLRFCPLKRRPLGKGLIKDHWHSRTRSTLLGLSDSAMKLERLQPLRLSTTSTAELVFQLPHFATGSHAPPPPTLFQHCLLSRSICRATTPPVGASHRLNSQTRVVLRPLPR